MPRIKSEPYRCRTGLGPSTTRSLTKKDRNDIYSIYTQLPVKIEDEGYGNDENLPEIHPNIEGNLHVEICDTCRKHNCEGTLVWMYIRGTFVALQKNESKCSGD